MTMVLADDLRRRRAIMSAAEHDWVPLTAAEADALIAQLADALAEAPKAALAGKAVGGCAVPAGARLTREVTS